MVKFQFRLNPVVVVEDNDLNLKLVKALLASGGYRYFTAMDAETGIQLVKAHLPDLVLMDIQLPGMDGLSATRVIKDDPSTCHIPVVALSAHAMKRDQRAAQSNGVAGYIKLIEAILSRDKYEIKCLTSGSAALEAVTQFLPDIVLLDVIMPDLNGFEVLKKIKAHPDTQGIPVVLITQLDSPKDKATGLEAGADDFLNKPLNLKSSRCVCAPC